MTPTHSSFLSIHTFYLNTNLISWQLKVYFLPWWMGRKAFHNRCNWLDRIKMQISFRLDFHSLSTWQQCCVCVPDTSSWKLTHRVHANNINFISRTHLHDGTVSPQNICHCCWVMWDFASEDTHFDVSFQWMVITGIFHIDLGFSGNTNILRQMDLEKLICNVQNVFVDIKSWIGSWLAGFSWLITITPHCNITIVLSTAVLTLHQISNRLHFTATFRNTHYMDLP